MRKSFLSTKTALSLVLSFILPLQMLATELGEAGKRLAALPGVSNVKSHATFKNDNKTCVNANIYSIYQVFNKVCILLFICYYTI